MAKKTTKSKKKNLSSGDGPILSMGQARLMQAALALAAAAAAWLLYGDIALLSDPNAATGCSAEGFFDCDKLRATKYSKIVGIPITTFALGAYAALGFLVSVATGTGAVARGALRLVVTSSVGALLYGAFLVSVMVSHATACKFCLTMDASMLVVFVVGLRALRAAPDGASDMTGPLRRALVVGLVVFAVPLAVFLNARAGHEETKLAEANEGVDLSEAAPAVELAASGAGGEKARKIDERNYYIPVQPDDAVYGPSDAKVTVIEFADFQCGYCKKLFYALKPLKEKYKDQSVRFVFKHFPMGKKCNDTINNDRHRYACTASEAADCARQQGQFWPMHDLLFKNQHKLKYPDLEYYASEVGLDMTEFKQCMRGPTAKEAIKADVRTYDETGIAKGTPRTFINGRFFKGVLPQSTLEHLIEQELGRRAPGEKPQRAATPAPTKVVPATAPAQVRVDYGRPFYMDTFEASIDAEGRAISQVGVAPANATWYEAKAACEKSGKRLCTTEEWVSACQSAAAVDDDLSGSFADDYVEGNQFPYADWHEPRWCRDSQADKRDAEGKVIKQGTAGKTGERPRCATPSGIFDLGGNVAEWAGADEELAVLLGGDYRSKDKAGCFRPNSTFGPGHRNDRIGFRCCSNELVDVAGAAVEKKAPDSMIGKKVPTFVGELMGGGTVASKDFRGDVTYLSFYASWCGPCRRELPALKELHSQLKDRGLNVIGVGVDTDGTKSAAMARKYGVDYPVILDPRGKILGLFDVKSMPTTYLIDRDGVIVDKLVGWGKTEEKLPKVIKKVEELL